MALAAINAAVGGVASNSYVTQAQAQAYFDMLFGPGADAWNAADATAPGGDQCKALLLAQRHLSRLVYIGRRYNPGQMLQFPRWYPLQGSDPEKILDLGLNIPQAVKDAQCEEAAYILMTASGLIDDSRASLQQQGVNRLQIGSLQERYVIGSEVADGSNVVCPIARRLLKHWIRMGCAADPDPGSQLQINSWGYNPGGNIL